MIEIGQSLINGLLNERNITCGNNQKNEADKLSFDKVLESMFNTAHHTQEQSSQKNNEITDKKHNKRLFDKTENNTTTYGKSQTLDKTHYESGKSTELEENEVKELVSLLNIIKNFSNEDKTLMGLLEKIKNLLSDDTLDLDSDLLVNLQVNLMYIEVEGQGDQEEQKLVVMLDALNNYIELKREAMTTTPLQNEEEIELDVSTTNLGEQATKEDDIINKPRKHTEEISHLNPKLDKLYVEKENKDIKFTLDEKLDISNTKQDTENVLNKDLFIQMTAENIVDEKPTLINQSSNILNQVISELKLHKIHRNGNSEISIQLVPENLGKLSFKITSRENIVTAQIFTETVQTKEIIEQNINDLRNALSEKGLTVTNLEVNVGQDSSAFKQKEAYYQSKKRQNRALNNVDDELNIVGSFERMETNPYLEKSSFDMIG
ncbi:flagellar hook-length control protein FliK [Serpentinicella sp. ANB-PHB4]|uniref:flagellar hook-length control protein FliK n=1 Tax=Serpentinicella sp. ANB-PHB4 TaxID=3074076 RepID=UPI002858A6D6|nr:flagellar hook-length control protein FliK [Serpentinicella sp. ANB-PHB4]MDR5658266.1 flagellar hook-length control protein FliK [Serpentinicella sp. ANB-PHB4]